MRGKLIVSSQVAPETGLIPAHAGKTLHTKALGVEGGAHPRACGENFEHVGETVPFVGSSPRMRGKPSSSYVDMCPSGLIPAHAGKTGYKRVGEYSTEAHPRACGENRLPYRKTYRATGSSPRMRGKLVTSHCFLLL